MFTKEAWGYLVNSQLQADYAAFPPSYLTTDKWCTHFDNNKPAIPPSTPDNTSPTANTVRGSRNTTHTEQAGRTKPKQTNANTNVRTAGLPPDNNAGNASISSNPCVNKACNAAYGNAYAKYYTIGHDAGSAYANRYNGSYKTGLADDHVAILVSNDNNNKPHGYGNN